jgi:hypothetical protein
MYFFFYKRLKHTRRNRRALSLTDAEHEQIIRKVEQIERREGIALPALGGAGKVHQETWSFET